MIFIGVTGGIGSGKSLVCSQFAALSIPIFFADIVARDIVGTDNSLQKKIEEVFDISAIALSSASGRKQLADIVFTNPGKLQQLNAIVHPAVFHRLDEWKGQQTKKTNTGYALVEAALIFESGLEQKLDYVLAITADEPVRISRVMERDALSEKQVTDRMNNQMKPEELAELSDFILHNNGTPEELRKKVQFFHILFTNLKQRQEVQ